MIKIANFSSRQFIAIKIILISLFHAQASYFQSIFTESATVYSSLHLIETKDGRSVWSDFYSNEVSDVLVLENNNHVSKTFFLIRNNTLINVQAIFIVRLIADWAERQAFSEAISTDGRTAMQIFIQNTRGAFGNVVGRCTSIIEYSV